MERSTFFKRLIFGFALVNVLTALIVVIPLFKSHQQVRQKASMETSSLVRIMERTVSGIIEQVDIVLQTCVEETELQLEKGVDKTALEAFIHRQSKHLPELNALRIVDATGRVVYGVGPPLGKGITIADRDYFIQARDEPQSGLIFSKPLVARTKPIRSIFLARRINHPDGSFGGVVYTAIPLARFQSLFQSLYLGSKGIVTLINLDNSPIVRYPEFRNNVTTEEPRQETAEFAEEQRSSLDTGIFSLKSPLDGIERVVSYRKVSSYPGYLFVGIANDDYFATWRSELLTMMILMSLVVTVTGGASWLLFAGWKRQEALNRRLDQQSRTDVLTECANRRHFLEALENERQRTVRYAKGFCVMALDLDFFKGINDKFGHLRGDQALCHFTSIAKNSLRSLDTLGRMGGEEFAVLLPETSIDSAVKIAERIRTELESSPIVLDSALVTLTVSIGIYAWQVDGTDTIEQLLSRADMALYQAKKAGRNQVHSEA